jgi:cytochrome b561
VYWKNTNNRWGWISIIIHWLTAVTVTGLFVLGLWMVELDYYDAWYKKAPFTHKSIGILLFGLTMLRFFWRSVNVIPEPLKNHTPFERKAAHAAHLALYLLLISVMISGYLISTADGRAIEVFGWFKIPAILHGIKQQEDIAGSIHLALAITLIGTAVVHALAAIKHHVIDRDQTLKRILGITGNQ